MDESLSADAVADPGDLVRRYLAAIESGASSEALARFFTPDVVQEEFPNRLFPDGATRDLAGILAGAERGRQVLRRQHYEIRSILSSPPAVAVEVVWAATVAIPIGTLEPGDELRARFCMVLELESGRIRRQRNYDCFDPF